MKKITYNISSYGSNNYNDKTSFKKVADKTKKFGTHDTKNFKTNLNFEHNYNRTNKVENLKIFPKNNNFRNSKFRIKNKFIFVL